MSNIEWTGRTWNPLTGCSIVSAGCANCYAMKMANRLQHIPHSATKYAGTTKKTDGGKVTWTGTINLDEKALLEPLKWKKPALVFVNSMSDLFHKDVPFGFIDKIFAIMALTPQHTYQVLTKRPERMLEYFNSAENRQFLWARIGDTAWNLWKDSHKAKFPSVDRMYEIMRPILDYGYKLPNVWLGTSVEDQKTANQRIPHLLKVPAAVRFLSCEPLLGAINLNEIAINLANPDEVRPWLELKESEAFKNGAHPMLHWVIAGGESGSNARPVHPDWLRLLRDQCTAANVPFFFKQWGNWAPIDKPHEQDDINPLAHNERWLNYAGGHGFHGEAVYRMRNVGKKAAGRLLDGKVHDAMPAGFTQLETSNDKLQTTNP